ncbi:DUF2577 domain-containing protein [Cytobacillus purgationiresistens]|uniref:Orotate phosphoribosyltransferase n=1 Tax=Cytobacillus purgationiresistens TaxID=863449 RepID=A0ABU0AIM9_9BACI|nr:DUF2577 domain-containing protein [Cytobacillus purgationiresistens]MDQ0269930.1 orotate phosphoribosyltransferase [Cytobacillus purgationiresistens]
MLEIVKKAAIGANDATNPVNVLFGKVIKASPFEIEIHQKLTLTEEFLVVTDKVKDLSNGDKVVLLRVQGGNQFIVLDKVVES